MRSLITNKTDSLLIIIFLYFIIIVQSASGKNIEQTIKLDPGWNSIFLEIDPLENRCENVFKDIPIDSVWVWNSKSSSIEFIKNPDDLIFEPPSWFVYYPPEKPYAFKTTLFRIYGEQSYLIKLNGNKSVLLKLRGTPCLPKIDWKINSYNLVGFHLYPGKEPNFAEFFGPSIAHNNSDPDVYFLNSTEQWEKATKTKQMKSGEAYWVYCFDKTKYVGRLKVEVEIGDVLNFGENLVEQKLSLLNLSKDISQISISYFKNNDSRSYEDVNIPISRWVPVSENTGGWTDIGSNVNIEIEETSEIKLRLAVRRIDLPSNGSYTSILKINDNKGSMIYLPVSVSYNQSYSGLWVGNAVIKKVSQPSSNNTKTIPTSSEFQFRLIVHVDKNGQAKLLKEVIQMWKQGEEKKQGKYVLITNENLLTNQDYIGPGLRDGRSMGRRISSAVFSFSKPLLMEGTFSIGSSLSCGYTIGFNDPLNPFKHKYHPDHNNLDEEYKNIIKEAYDIHRKVIMTFTLEDPTNLNLSIAGWRDKDIGGIYKEEIKGLHKQSIFSEGIFRLHKVSNVEVLNE